MEQYSGRPPYASEKKAPVGGALGQCAGVLEGGPALQKLMGSSREPGLQVQHLLREEDFGSSTEADD